MAEKQVNWNNFVQKENDMDFGEFLSSRVETIVVHRHPHNDELLAAYILKTFGGNSFFPGVNHATIEYWDCVPHGKTWEECLKKEHKLLIGMGYSPFDEHLPNGERKPDHCTATLVAEALELREDASLKPLLDFTLKREQKKGENNLELPALIKTLWSSDMMGMDKNEIVTAWAFTIYDAIYQRGMDFSEGTYEDFKNATKVTIRNEAGRSILFAYGRSDKKEFGRYARFKKAGIILWMNSQGNAIIQTDHRLKIDLSPVVRAIRIAEICEAYRLKPKEAPFPLTLSRGCAPGTIDECPLWFYHAEARSLMNGSDGHAVPPTLLSLERLANIMMAVLSHDRTLFRTKPPQKKSFRPHSNGTPPAPTPALSEGKASLSEMMASNEGSAPAAVS